MSLLEALLLDDLEKHVQLNCARWTSYVVKTYGDCRGHAHARNTKPRHIQEQMTQWTLGAFDKGKGKHGKGKGKGKQGQQGRDRSKDKDKNKDAVTTRRIVGARRTGPTKVIQRERTRKNTTDAHNLDSTKPANSEPEVEIGGFDMGYFNVDAMEVRECEWNKIGVDTGAGRQLAPGRHVPEADSW